ncbi:MAG: endolytic transglycosylase MltG [Muribaculaceae bacterium]
MEIDIKSYLKKPLVWVISAAIIILITITCVLYPYFCSKAEISKTVYVYPKMNVEMLNDSLNAYFGDSFGNHVSNILSMKGVDVATCIGAYKVTIGDSPISLARRLINGRQTPIKFTFNNLRTKEQFAERVGEKFLISKAEMLNALENDSITKAMGCDSLTIVALLMPDSYEFYWSVTPAKMLNAFKKYHDKWWTTERISKAKALGLTPFEVTTLASIVEEETSKSDERGKVARLYLNRLAKGMLLQADPTVKFAIGDFSIKRVTKEHLRVQSPYNTYVNAGLPPSPIRFPEKSTIDAVLNAPEHDYTFMCAKEDFSGYHNYTTSFSVHLANARIYQAALNARGIK